MHKINKFIFILTSFFALQIEASTYLAGSILQVEQQSPDSGKIHSDLSLAGNGSSLYLGYRLSFIAVEGLYKNLSAKASDSGKSFKISGHSNGLGARLYLISLLNFKFGVLNHSYKGKISQEGSEDFNFEANHSSKYQGVGIRFNVSKLDVFLDFSKFELEDDNENDVELEFDEVEFGARYYF